MPSFTKHARERASQRSISDEAIELLLDYGDVQRVKGADSYFFNAPAKRRLRNDLGRDSYRRCERHLGIYAIVGDDGRIVTVAYRRHRLRRR
jgi:hypothetical protein